MTVRLASCTCGQLRLTASEEPLRVSVCHCLACQRRTGSAFGIQARFERRAVEIVGDSSVYVRTGDAGSRISFHFCPQCGATVHFELEGYAEHVAVPVGAFAEPGFPAPSAFMYEQRRHAWLAPLVDADHTP